MKKKRVLICGASGFIGRNIFEALLQNRELEVVGTYKSSSFYSPALNLRRVNLTEEASVDKLLSEDFDVIIQAAATTSGAKDIIETPEIHVTDNAVMNSLIFRAAHRHHVPHVIFFSCTVMYPSGHFPLKETDINLNTELGKYFGIGWTKIYVEKMCEFYARLGRTKYTVIRHSNIYGPHDKFDLERSHVFGATITKVLGSANDQISVWGTGEEKRDLLYVNDLVKFVKLAMVDQKTPFEIFNVGMGETISVENLVKRIINVSAKDLTILHDLSKPTIDSSITIDISKAKEQLGWEPQVSLNEGIRRTIDWYLKIRTA